MKLQIRPQIVRASSLNYYKAYQEKWFIICNFCIHPNCAPLTSYPIVKVMTQYTFVKPLLVPQITTILLVLTTLTQAPGDIGHLAISHHLRSQGQIGNLAISCHLHPVAQPHFLFITLFPGFEGLPLILQEMTVLKFFLSSPSCCMLTFS